MQVTKGTWRTREQCVPGSFSSSPAQERLVYTQTQDEETFDLLSLKMSMLNEDRH